MGEKKRKWGNFLIEDIDGIPSNIWKTDILMKLIRVCHKYR